MQERNIRLGVCNQLLQNGSLQYGSPQYGFPEYRSLQYYCHPSDQRYFLDFVCVSGFSVDARRNSSTSLVLLIFLFN